MMTRSSSDDRVRLQEGLAAATMLAFTEDARSMARRAYDTGDRKRSTECLLTHLTEEQKFELRAADQYTCPTCGHLLKDRRT